MFVITVEFLIKEGDAEKFRLLMLENARASLTKETGCKQFDVCFDPDDARKCFLYEVYDDQSAFDVHLTMPHFRNFDAAVGPMLENKKVRALRLVQGATIS